MKGNNFMKRQYLSLLVLCGAYGNFASGMESPSQLALPKPGKLFSTFQEFANSPEETLTQEQFDILKSKANQNGKSENGLRSQIIAAETLLAFGNPQDSQALGIKIKTDSDALAEKLKAVPQEERLATTYYLMFAEQAVTRAEEHKHMQEVPGHRKLYSTCKEIQERRKRLTTNVIPQLTKETQTLEQTAQQLHQVIEAKTAELTALRNQQQTTTKDYRIAAENLYTAALVKKILTKCDSATTNQLKEQFINIKARWDSLTEKKGKLEKSLAEDTLLPDVKASKQTQLENTLKQIAETTKALHSAARDYKLATNTYTAADKTWWKTRGTVYLPVFPENKAEDTKEPIIVD